VKKKKGGYAKENTLYFGILKKFYNDLLETLTGCPGIKQSF